MCDTAGTLPRQQSPTQKVFRFPTGEQALVVNVDYSLSLPPPTPPSLFLLSHATVVDPSAQRRCV
jgi:hypothetical protein